MAFVAIPNNDQYEYDNAPPDPGVGHPMRALWLKSSNGIRTSHNHSVYVRCRRIGSGDVDHGELSKSYWDARGTEDDFSVYVVNSFEPDLVFDFKTPFYKTGGVDRSLANSVTHSRAGQATMTDSDGKIKWAPHNLLSLSNTFDSGWYKRPATSIVANNAVGPYGIANTASTLGFSSTTSQLYNLTIMPFSVGDKVTLAAWVRSDNITSLTLSINGRAQQANNTPFANVAVTSTWSLVKFEATVQADDNGLFFIFGWNNIHNVNTQIGDIEIYGAHMYRSDLGGMVNNPDTNDSYVPTTSSPVYLPRVGHHIYNGDAWVNEGILHESEARTNLTTYSDISGGSWAGERWGSSTRAYWNEPDGAVRISTSTSSNITGNRIYNLSFGTGSANTHCVSFYYKSGTSVPFLHLRLDSNSRFGVCINTSTDELTQGYYDGVTNSFAFSTQGIVDVGDGWRRFYGTFLSASNFNHHCFFYLSTSATTTSASFSGTETIDISGAQLEAGSTPSSYIPTSGATVTRAAETLTVPAANLPYSSTNMSIQIDGEMTYADNSLGPEIEYYSWLLSNGNWIKSWLYTNTDRTGQPSFQQRSASGLAKVNGSTEAYNPGINVPFNFAARHGSTLLNGAVDGTALTANTTPTVLPDLSSTDLNLGSTFMGTIGQFRMWDEDLTDAGIIEASAPSTEPSLQLTFDGSSTSSFKVLNWSE